MVGWLPAHVWTRCYIGSNDTFGCPDNRWEMFLIFTLLRFYVHCKQLYCRHNHLMSPLNCGNQICKAGLIWLLTIMVPSTYFGYFWFSPAELVQTKQLQLVSLSWGTELRIRYSCCRSTWFREGIVSRPDLGYMFGLSLYHID